MATVTIACVTYVAVVHYPGTPFPLRESAMTTQQAAPNSAPIPEMVYYDNNTAVHDAASYLGITNIKWGCVVEGSPLTVQLEYVRTDHTVARIVAYRPWRVLGWIELQGGAARSCEDAPRKSLPEFEISLMSIPRPVNYFSSTMHQVSKTFPSKRIHVVTNQTHHLYTPWTRLPNVDVHVVDVSWSVGLKEKSIAMYEYALSISTTNTLVLEDDLIVSPFANSILMNALGELKREGMDDFVLDCYVVSWQGKKIHKNLRYTFYEDDFGCCTQCMFFTMNVTRVMRRQMFKERQHQKPDPYDFIIHNTARSNRIPILGTHRAAAQHAGKVSTGLTGVAHLHQTTRFR